ncbi:aldose 1-epimerase [Flavimarina sp. Hel_I_48]|uniref:aldose 1-epimerase n=1 Tax=Flavimarina sp. Hel_I_48 TaxID=1392488 RepID=UPI0004DF3D6F|nr:aldose 1-epimerase [Flavimarina sp. Hel_I_48]
MTTLQSKNIIVKIDSGELVSILKNNHEYMHQKGTPGWGHSDTEMFPLIGPTEKASFKVHTPKGDATQDQHGLLRELEYKLTASDETSATFKKTYSADNPVKNSKFKKEEKPKNEGAGHPEYLTWPYDFTFEKSFKLNDKGLEIRFKINADQDMPFMLGYHPAFNLVTGNPVIKTDKCSVNLEEVLAVGSRALSVLDCSRIALEDKNTLTIETTGFKHFMLWTEVKNMVCIEPITFYPYAVKQDKLDSGFNKVGSKPKEFSVKILI